MMYSVQAVEFPCTHSHRRFDDIHGGAGAVFKRRTFTFGFGTGSEPTEVRLKPDFDTVLAWRKKSEGDKEWHEIDLNDVKITEPKGEGSPPSLCT